MKKALVIGYARSGKSVSKLLKQHGYEITITDIEAIADKTDLEAQGMHVFDQGHPVSLLETPWDLVVKNPGIPYHVPFVSEIQQRYPIISEIEVVLRFHPHYQFAAITGTNGKTTTTTLLYEMLKEGPNPALCAGNIGIPLSELALTEEAVLTNVAFEVSAFQLVATPSFKPKVATIMNLTPDHLDYFDSLEAYYQAKLLVYKNQTPDDFFLRNCDDAEIVKRTQDVKATVINYSLTKPADVCLRNGWIMYQDVALFATDQLKIVGLHNVQNALVAAVSAYLLGVDVKKIQKVIETFTGVEHRIEYVREYQGVKYYNDSKATNVESLIVALEAFNQPVILLAGGYDKHIGFDLLNAHRHQIKTLLAFGATKDQFQTIVKDAIIVDTMAQALAKAQAIAQPGDIVLLSPGCASYDQFDNYEQRGEQFKTLVMQLK